MKKRTKINLYKKKRKSKGKFFYIFRILLCLFFIFSVSFYLWLHYLIKKEESEIKRLKKENEVLQMQVKKFLTSDKYYEELLRTEFAYIKKGEKLFIYSDYLFKKHKKNL